MQLNHNLKISCYCLCTLIVISVIGFYFLPTANIVGDIVNGKDKYQQLCETCHGTKGYGDGPAANALANKPANIAQKLNKPFSTQDSLTEKVLVGKVNKGMPAWQGVISTADAADILAYIKSIQ